MPYFAVFNFYNVVETSTQSLFARLPCFIQNVLRSTLLLANKTQIRKFEDIKSIIRRGESEKNRQCNDQKISTW